MKKYSYLFLSSIIGLSSASPALAQGCASEELALAIAQDEYDEANGRYNSWAGSYNSRMDTIYNTYYIVLNGCGTNNIVCIEEAAADRNSAIAQLEWEGDDLRLERDYRSDLLSVAQEAYNACEILHG